MVSATGQERTVLHPKLLRAVTAMLRGMEVDRGGQDNWMRSRGDRPVRRNPQCAPALSAQIPAHRVATGALAHPLRPAAGVLAGPSGDLRLAPQRLALLAHLSRQAMPRARTRRHDSTGETRLPRSSLYAAFRFSECHDANCSTPGKARNRSAVKRDIVSLCLSVPCSSKSPESRA
jgi:hypothetical protein